MNNTIGIRAAQLELRNNYVAFNEVGINVLRTLSFARCSLESRATREY